jgi:hypothetical protein
MAAQSPIVSIEQEDLTDSQVRGMVTRALRIHYYHANRAGSYHVLLWCGLSMVAAMVAVFLALQHQPGITSPIAVLIVALALTGTRYWRSRQHRKLAARAAKWLPLSVSLPQPDEHYKLVCETAGLEVDSTLLEAEKDVMEWSAAKLTAEQAVADEDYLCPFCGEVLEEADDEPLGGLEVPQNLILWYCPACDQRILTEQEVLQILGAAGPSEPPQTREESLADTSHSWGSRTIP